MAANTRCVREAPPYGGLHVTGGDERRFFTENKVAIKCFESVVTLDLDAMRCTGAASTGAVTANFLTVWPKLDKAIDHMLAREYCEGAK